MKNNAITLAFNDKLIGNMSFNGFCANPRCKCDSFCFESAVSQARNDVFEAEQSETSIPEPEVLK